MLPVIDISPLRGEHDAEKVAVAKEIRHACETAGFFYICGHGVPQSLIHRIVELAREFFRQPLETKLSIDMKHGGRAWRGYFPVGRELTSGRPDQKEGLYFGSELGESHPHVLKRTPLHGANLFPDLPGFKRVVLEYMDALTAVAQTVLEGFALSLDLPASFFFERFCNDPLVLFRIFNYPGECDTQHWGVGEHTDYGLLTILLQDDVGGLEVRTPDGWIEATPIAETFICNIGDMLDRMTAGRYVSTPHRVKNSTDTARLSLPFFLDPNFDVRVEPIAARDTRDARERWDAEDVHAFGGTYGEYVLRKVSRVFPELGDEWLAES